MASIIHSPLRLALCVAAVALAGAAQADEGVRVVRDPETGKLRAPTADEARDLDAREPRGAALRRAAPRARVLNNGTIALEVGEDHMMSSVARVNADGSLDRYCVPAGKAQAVLNAPQQPTRHVHKATAQGTVYEDK